MCQIKCRFLVCLPVLLALLCFSASAATSRIAPAVSTNLVGGTIDLALISDPTLILSGFQWFKDNAALADTSRITGTQLPILHIDNIRLEDSGSYMLAFTNYTVSTNVIRQTASATVYVVTQPEIVQEPTSLPRGSDVTFSVSATGGLLSYQWLWQGQAIAGATSSTLRFTNAYANANAGYYTVRISNPVNPAGIVSTTALLVTKPTPAGTYQGIFLDTDAPSPESTGQIQFNVSATHRTFSGRISIGMARSSFSGAFSPSHDVEVPVSGRTGPLTLRLQLLTINDAAQAIGEIQGDGWTAQVRADRWYYSSKAPTALAGRYTLALQNTNLQPAAPNGDGYAAMVLRSTGTLTLQGRAADGTAFSQSTGLSRTGDFPLYASLYRGRGNLAGWLRLARQTNSSVQGSTVYWMKSAGPDKLYPDGFGLVLQPAGSSFTRPDPAPALNFTNAVATLYGGDLLSGDTPVWTLLRVTLRPPASFRAEESPERLVLKLSSSTGTLTGSFIDFVTGKPTPIYGVLLQQQSAARGFFLGKDSAGEFMLVPASR